jgi:hypothetical protein
MAKVIVDRAASRARSWEQLYEDLAREIPAGKERNRFLTQNRGSRVSGRSGFRG